MFQLYIGLCDRQRKNIFGGDASLSPRGNPTGKMMPDDFSSFRFYGLNNKKVLEYYPHMKGKGLRNSYIHFKGFESPSLPTSVFPIGKIEIDHKLIRRGF